MPNGGDKNFIRLCGAIEGFRVRFGTWPTAVRLFPPMIADLRDHVLGRRRLPSSKRRFHLSRLTRPSSRKILRDIATATAQKDFPSSSQTFVRATGSEFSPCQTVIRTHTYNPTMTPNPAIQRTRCVCHACCLRTPPARLRVSLIFVSLGVCSLSRVNDTFSRAVWRGSALPDCQLHASREFGLLFQSLSFTPCSRARHFFALLLAPCAPWILSFLSLVAQPFSRRTATPNPAIQRTASACHGCCLRSIPATLRLSLIFVSLGVGQRIR